MHYSEVHGYREVTIYECSPERAALLNEDPTLFRPWGETSSSEVREQYRQRLGEDLALIAKVVSKLSKKEMVEWLVGRGLFVCTSTRKDRSHLEAMVSNRQIDEWYPRRFHARRGGL